jgi:hypothetical protein
MKQDDLSAGTCRQDKVEIQVVTTVDGFVWFWANFAIPSLFG